jgi:hypothetical protein
VCDAFVYIPQYGAGTASLNVTVAASIILHNFAVWARFPEAGRAGEKFVVGERPQRSGARGARACDCAPISAHLGSLPPPSIGLHAAAAKRAPLTRLSLLLSPVPPPHPQASRAA